jgi:histidyl-tRNA synthetase
VLAAQRQDVSAALKTAAVKRLVESDPDLKPQLDTMTLVFRNDQQQAKEAEATLKSLHEGSLAELAALAKLLA